MHICTHTHTHTSMYAHTHTHTHTHTDVCYIKTFQCHLKDGVKYMQLHVCFKTIIFNGLNVCYYLLLLFVICCTLLYFYFSKCSIYHKHCVFINHLLFHPLSLIFWNHSSANYCKMKPIGRCILAIVGNEYWWSSKLRQLLKSAFYLVLHSLKT